MATWPGRKQRPIDRPYEVWQTPDGSWTWKVLKKWQKDDHAPYARWFCAVSSPFTYGSIDMGDTYAAEVMANAVKVSEDYDEVAA